MLGCFMQQWGRHKHDLCLSTCRTPILAQVKTAGGDVIMVLRPKGETPPPSTRSFRTGSNSSTASDASLVPRSRVPSSQPASNRSSYDGPRPRPPRPPAWAPPQSPQRAPSPLQQLGARSQSHDYTAQVAHRLPPSPLAPLDGCSQSHDYSRSNPNHAGGVHPVDDSLKTRSSDRSQHVAGGHPASAHLESIASGVIWDAAAAHEKALAAHVPDRPGSAPPGGKPHRLPPTPTSLWRKMLGRPPRP